MSHIHACRAHTRLQISLSCRLMMNTQQLQYLLKSSIVAGSSGLIILLFNLYRQHKPKRSMKGRTLVSIDDLSNDKIMVVMKLAKHYKNERNRYQMWSFWNILKTFIGLYRTTSTKVPIIGLLFLESSTRTRCSFEAAAKRLGCKTVSICDVSTSSIAKGETIEDTAQMLYCYCDALVVRHSEKGVALRLSKRLPPSFPLFNGGDGTGEHPTQALLDFFAIENEFPKRLNDWKTQPLVITLLGDLNHGRTAHSLAKLMVRFNTRLQFCSPEGVGMPLDVLQELDRLVTDTGNPSLRYSNILSLSEALKSSDIIYATRLQTERYQDTALPSAFTDDYILKNDLIEKYSPKHQIILHPLPRNNEIEVSVDSNPRARYFQQAEDGMYVRMALLSLALGF